MVEEKAFGIAVGVTGVDIDDLAVVVVTDIIDQGVADDYPVDAVLLHHMIEVC